MVEVSLTRLMFAWVAAFVIHAVIMQASSKYGSPRGYFLLGSVPAALTFFVALLFMWPMLGL